MTLVSSRRIIFSFSKRFYTLPPRIQTFVSSFFFLGVDRLSSVLEAQRFRWDQLYLREERRYLGSRHFRLQFVSTKTIFFFFSKKTEYSMIKKKRIYIYTALVE